MFQIEVLVKDEWHPVSPVGGPPYTYNTSEEARRMSRLCYDADPTKVRIVPA